LTTAETTDIGIVAGIVLLIVWAIGVFMYSGPGWLNLLLTAGVTLIIWRIVVRGTPHVSRDSGDESKRA
jgi:hypothetical protein